MILRHSQTALNSWRKGATTCSGLCLLQQDINEDQPTHPLKEYSPIQLGHTLFSHKQL